MKTILVNGGAGYIGSVAVKELIKKGYNVIVIDNLSKGLKELVDVGAKFYEFDLTEKEKVMKVFSENKIDGVIHFAAYKAVGESMEDAPHYSDNIRGLMSVLDAMVAYDVKRIIFSSTAAVYGEPDEEILTEKTPTKPVNYYGFTKLKCEEIMEWYTQIHGLKPLALRYFNVAGDGGLNYIDPNALNVLPIIMEVVFGIRSELEIYGNDYDSRDGTCIRDYIDVRDLVDAHILALDNNYCGPINLGTSKGTSVMELVKYTEEVTGKEFPHKIVGRRAGDPGVLTASNKLAKEILGWEPKYNIKDMIQTTYDAYVAKKK